MNIKNIIIINDFDYIQGGASKVAIDEANMLCDKYNVVFFSSIHKEDDALNKNIESVTLNSKEFLNYPNKFKGMINGIKYKECKDKLDELLDKYSPKDTVCHIHGWTKALSSIVFKVCKDKSFKTYLTTHEYFSVCPNGGLCNYKTNTVCELKCMSNKCIKCNCDSRNYLFKLYRVFRERQYYKDIDFDYINVIFVSELNEKLIKANRNITSNNKVIYNQNH